MTRDSDQWIDGVIKGMVAGLFMIPVIWALLVCLFVLTGE